MLELAASVGRNAQPKRDVAMLVSDPLDDVGILVQPVDEFAVLGCKAHRNHHIVFAEPRIDRLA